MFKDENQIQWKEQVAAVADMGLIDGYLDGYFYPSGAVTQGAYCKILYRLAVGNGYWAQLLNFYPTGNWDDLKGTAFGCYVGFLGQLIDKNPSVAGDWGRRMRAEKFCTSSCIRQNDALLWLHFVCKVCYRLVSDNFLISIPQEDRNKKASREWLSNLIYVYCSKIVEELKQASGKDKRAFWEHWSKCGENVDHILGPNPEILRVFEKCSPIEYEMLTYAENYIAPFYSVQIPIMYELIGLASSLSGKTQISTTIAYQYTSLKALKSMIDEFNSNIQNNSYERVISKAIGPRFQLHMSNAEFLNDPDEGEILENNFHIENAPHETPERVQEYHPRQEYISCLTIEKEEKLPMWVQYGDRGKGCRIEFRLNSINEFHEVTYTPRDKLPEDITCTISEMQKRVNVYYKSNPKDTTYAVYGWARSLLKKYGYYFKDKYYSQEKEIRSIITPKLEDIHMWKDPRDGEIFPRSYVLLKEPLIVESVMLGPKCPNPEQIAVALKNLGITRILRSNIHFQ